MSTRSAIIQKTAEGYRGIYCHHDGYLQGVGRALIEQNQYSTDEAVSALISRGDMSSISKWPDECRSYAEMDGEYPFPFNAPIFGESIAEVADQILLRHNGYVYVWEDNAWTVNGEPLPDAVYFDEEVTPYGEIAPVPS